MRRDGGFLKAIVLIALLALGPSPQASIAFSAPLTRSSSALSFRIEPDDSVYLPGQPIYLLVTVRNTSDSTFEDFGWIQPPLGMSIGLFRGGRRVPDHYLKGAWVASRPGPNLEPGAKVCEILALFEGFGREMPIDIPYGARYRGAGGLPPGKYHVTAYLIPHVFSHGIPDFIQADTEFRVQTPSYISRFDERALRMLERARGRSVGARSMEAWQRVRREGLDRSRYLNVLAYTFAPSENRYSLKEFASDLARAGEPPLKVAALLYERERQVRLDHSADRAWIRGARPAFSDTTIQCLLERWELLADTWIKSEAHSK